MRSSLASPSAGDLCELTTELTEGTEKARAGSGFQPQRTLRAAEKSQRGSVGEVAHDCRLPEPSDPEHPHRLACQLLDELGAIPGPPGPFEFTREYLSACRKREKARHRLCLDFLNRLVDDGSTLEGDLIQRQVARARVREYLCRYCRDSISLEELEWHLKEALVDARASGQTGVVYSVLMCLGHFYRDVDCFQEAEWHYKEALAYVSPRWNDTWMTQVLFWLGTLYADYEETLPMAVYIFDWRSRFVPHGFSSFEEMQKCRLALGEREQLLAELEVDEGASPREIANAIGAAQALGRRKKRIVALARLGIATAQSDRWWRRHFEGVLERTIGAPAERSGEAPAG